MSEILAISEKCLDCPAVKAMSETIEVSEQTKKTLIDQLMGDHVDKQVEQMLEQFPDLRENYEGMSVAEIARKLRRESGFPQVELLDDQIESYREEIGRITLHCPGVLVLFGESNDMTVTANVCMSPENPHDVGQLEDIVIIDRKSKPQPDAE
jgi:hypothetical protein